MKNKLYITAEAYHDMYSTKQYISCELCNREAADSYTSNVKREIATLPDFPFKFSKTGICYQGMIIYKKVYKSYLIFYVVDEDNSVHVLRILKDISDWQTSLEKIKQYHYLDNN